MARPATINPDGFWGTFSTPRAVRHVGSEDQTYIGHVNTSGDAMVTAFDETGVAVSSFTLNAALDVDGHLVPVFRVRSDGKIQAFYSAHNGALRERLSSSAEDISAWAAESTVLSGSYTYPNVWDLTGKVVLHARSGSSSDGSVIFTESTDDGASWSTQKVLYYAGAVGAYFKTAKHPTDDRIDYMVTDGNPNNDATSVYHFYREGDSFYKSDGTLIGTTGDLDGTTGSAFGPSDLTKVWDQAVQGVDGHVWDIAHDGSGNPVMIIAALPAGGVDHEMHHAAWNGTSWDINKIADVGDSVLGSPEDAVSGGATLDPEDASRVWLSIEDAGLAQVWRYDTADGGSTWTGTQITHDYRLNMRPVVPVNRSTTLRVIWWRGRYTGSSSYDAALMGYGDDPPTGDGALSLTNDGEVFTAFANSEDDPIAIGDWEQQESVDVFAVSAVNGSLQHQGVSTGSWHFIRCSAGASRSTRMLQTVQACVGGSSQIWILQGGHFETGSAGNNFAGVQLAIDRGPDRYVPMEREGTSHLGGNAVDTDPKDKNVPYRISTLLDGFEITGHDFVDESSASHTGSNFDSGWSGIGGNDLDPIEMYEFFDCTHWELTATGLSTGDKLQLRNALGVVLKEATESGGTATIDMTDVVIPEVNDLVVVDSGDALVGGLTLAGSGGPMEYARGGDAYALTATVAPDQPTITATVEGAHQVSVESSAYSHPDGTDIAGVEWQIATDSGFTTGLETVTESFDDPSDAADPPGYVWSALEEATEYFFRVRHQDANGQWSDWSAADSATTDSEVKPATPSIDTASVEATSVVLGSSDYDDNGQGRTHVQSHWQIDESGGDWSTPVNESEEDPDNLTSISVPGLTAGTNYQARVRYRASDGTWSEWSAAKAFTTLSVSADQPAQPTLTVEETTQTTARISTSAYSDPDSEPHQATEWLVSDFPGSGTFGLAYRVAHFTSSADLEETTFEGLTPGKEYHVTARHKAADGDWSDWATFVPFTTVAHPLGGELLHVTGPWHGQVVRGTVDVDWRPASETDAVFDIQVSEDAGVSFSEVVSGHASSPYSWDVSGLTDGYKLMRTRARSTATGETTDWQNKWVYVDNADELAAGAELFAFNSSEQDPDEPLTDKWTPLEDLQGGQPIWSYGTSGQLYNSSDGETEFMRIGLDAALEPKQVDIVADVMLGSLGGSFPWQWFPEQLWAGVGVIMSDVAGVTEAGGRGALASIYSIPINAHGDCLTRASGPMHFEAFSNFDDTFFEMSEALLEIGRLHFYLTVDGCNKQPRYGMRMRFTTIQELGGGRRRMRMQVGIAGRGIEPDPERGWQVERTFETDLTCGQAGCVVKAITTTHGPFVAIGHFTVHALEYGECDAPEGFTDPDPETCPPPIFDLTIFGDDDETPIWGSVDSAGEVTDPSFSTFPGHDRPYLKVWPAGSEHEADPIEGSSSIGAVRVEVLDKRTVACDPQSGLLTAAMADDDGFSALIGRRAILRERLGDGTYQIVLHGVVGPVELLDSLVTYQLDIRSMREREREVRLFTTQAKTMSAWPYGPVEGYGCVTTFEETPICLFPPADVAQGRYVRVRTEEDGLIVGYLTDDAHTIDDYFIELLELGRPQYVVDEDGNTSTRRKVTEALIRWRPAGGGEEDWVELDDMQTVKFGAVVVNGLGYTQQEGLFLFEGGTFRIQLNATDAAILPAPGQQVEWQVLPDTEPSEAFPLWYEGFAGDLLSRVYDGDFSDRDPNIRYDASNIPQGPFLRMRITEPEDDLRGWVETHIYQPSIWVPSLAEDGTIFPVSTRLPDASVSLTTLTNAEVVGVPLWRQDGGSAVPIATVRIFREGRTPLGAPGDGNRRAVPRDSVGDEDNPFTYEFTEVEVTRLARSSALLTTKAKTFEPDTLRTVAGESVDGDTFDVLLEGAHRQALDIVRVLTTRYAYGPELVTLRARDLAAVRAIRVGTWFLLETDHLPDLQNRTRGGTLLCLALRRQKDPGLAWDITALVGGPGASCASGTPSQPTLTVNDDLSITVTVPGESFGWSSGFSSGFGSGSGTSGTEIRVEYAISDTEPDPDSGLWTLLGTRTGAGDVRTEPFPAGVTVWIRVQAQQGLCRPSAWTAPQSVAVGETTPALLKLWITIGLDGTPVVHWWENPPTLGLRIEYGVVDSDRDNLYDTTIEVDAKQPSASGWSSGFGLGFTAVSADRSYILSGVTVDPGHKIVVRATPFSGWDGANVTGTAGEPKSTFKHQTDALSPAGFSAGFSLGFGA